jgi:hypothetical protein
VSFPLISQEAKRILTVLRLVLVSVYLPKAEFGAQVYDFPLMTLSRPNHVLSNTWLGRERQIYTTNCIHSLKTTRSRYKYLSRPNHVLSNTWFGRERQIYTTNCIHSLKTTRSRYKFLDDPFALWQHTSHRRNWNMSISLIFTPGDVYFSSNLTRF